jgi:glycosyltransferase involved in cell wall biosynthesis
MTSLSIVIPAFNEQENVKAAIENISNVARQLNMDYEILLVNDGSKDRTGEIARTELESSIPQFRLIEHFPNRGYGGALRAGFAEASKELIAFIPSDNQFDFSEVHRLLTRMAPDIMIVSGFRVDRKDHFTRKFNAFGWNLVIRILFGYLTKDIDCGFKLFRRELLRHIHIQSNGAMIDTEMLAEACARGYKIAEVPVSHFPRIAGQPTGANLKVIIHAFGDLFAFRLRLWRELRNRDNLSLL